MSTVHDHPAVHGYLARLREVAGALPPLRRDELLTEIRCHIDDALAAPDPTGAAGDDRVRRVLARLGDPEDIVAAEMDQSPAPTVAPPASAPPPAADRSGWGVIEVVATLLVTIGTIVVPVVGPFSGAVLAWMSRRWSRTTKIVVSVVGVLPTLLLVALLLPVRNGSDPVEGDPVERVPVSTILVPDAGEPEPVLPGD